MQQWWFWLGIGGIGWFIYRRYKRVRKAKPIETRMLVTEQATPQPDVMGFQRFYIQLCRHDERFQYTYSQAKRLHVLSLLPMYETVAADEAPSQPDLLDEYDTEVEGEMYLETLQMKRKEEERG